MENIFLNLSVKRNKHILFGDYKTAIDEAYILSKQLNICCLLNYANQYSFEILPTMTQVEIDKMKETEIVIAM
jgi:hypothetical protein